MLMRNLRWDPMNLLWGLSLGLVVLYLLVASSSEFRAFAPYPVTDPVLYISVAIVGILAGFVTRGETTGLRFLVCLMVLALPIFVYGGALVLLWIEIGGSGLLDLFIVEAGRRVVIYFAVLGVVGAFGITLGFFLGELLS